MSEYTTQIRRLDWDRSVALLERQQELYRQLAAVTEDLLTQAGNAHDHASGFQHKPETCATCAAVTASDPAGEALPHLPVGAGADDHHGGLPELLGERARQAIAPLKEDVAVDVLGRKDLDDVGVFEVPLPEAERLGEGSADELVARQVRQGAPQVLVADPLAGLLREVRPDVELDGAGGPGHESILRDLKQRRKFHADHCYLYFEVDRAQRVVTVTTSWLPNLKPVREALSPIGFGRDQRGAWKAYADLGDHVGVMRKVSKALELQLLEASSLIASEE